MGQTVDRRSEGEVLRARIGALLAGTTEVSGRARCLHVDPERHPVEAILTEISETQLPRRSVFRNGRGHELVLEIAAGRILKLGDPVPSTLMDGLDQSLLQALRDSAAGHGAAVGQVLHQFSEGSEAFLVETHLLEKPPSALDPGLPISEIFTERPDVPCGSEEDRLVAFFTSCEQFSRGALLKLGDDILVEYGADPERKALSHLSQSEQTEQQTCATDTGGEAGRLRCVIYAGHPTDGSAVLCVTNGAHFGLLTFEGRALDRVLTAWRCLSG